MQIKMLLVGPLKQTVNSGSLAKSKKFRRASEIDKIFFF